MKKYLKKIKILHICYKYIDTKLYKILPRIAPNLYSIKRYKKVFGRKPNLKNPKEFNEKLLWLKLYKYNNNELVTICADKYKVRQYIQEKNVSEILNELLFVCDDSSQIKWDELPNKFVLKCNHGCGYNIICNDKNKIDIEDTKKKIDKWLKEDYWKIYGETNYKYIKKKIICEKYLETADGYLPIDYKIYCFNGKPQIILVCTERENKLKLSFFDLNWNLINIGTYEGNRNIKKPKSLEKMLEYAQKLSENIPFVRVDFYEYNEQPIFGEMTFTPAACTATYYNEKGLELLGNMLEL